MVYNCIHRRITLHTSPDNLRMSKCDIISIWHLQTVVGWSYVEVLTDGESLGNSTSEIGDSMLYKFSLIVCRDSFGDVSTQSIAVATIYSLLYIHFISMILRILPIVRTL